MSERVTHTITGFELLEADGGGIRDNRVALIASEDAAKQWVMASSGYRRYVPYKETIVVYADLEDLNQGHREKLREQALAKLSKQEREALGL